MLKRNAVLLLSLVTVIDSVARADQGGFLNSGGSGSAASGISVTSNVANPAGMITMSCPSTGTAICAGGKLTFLSTDGTISISTIFTSGNYAEGCSGGGRGGHVTCSFGFSGSVSGTATINGVTQAIQGVTSQAFSSTGANVSGAFGWNSSYSPFYYTDSEHIIRSDDLIGTNQVIFDGSTTSLGPLYGSSGVALDATGRIYVADAYNCRIIRIDDMTGTNAASFGNCGTGSGQLYNPSAVALDPSGRIYIMDTSNARIVRIDDMTGANFTTYGTSGSGVGQFASFNSIAIDATGHIYIPDTANQRLVRMDDMNGTNWTVLTTSPLVNGLTYSLLSPAAVSFDVFGRIYIGDNEYSQGAIIRVDDMTGTNWTEAYIGSTGINSISVDSAGSVFVGGGGIRIVDNLIGILNSSGNVIGPIGISYIFGVTAVPLPAPRPPAITVSTSALTFANQNIGTASALQSVTISNFGGSPLNFSSIVASAGYTQTTNCPTSLTAGSNCTFYVSFAPSLTGPTNGALTITDNSFNLPSPQVISLTGVATAPAASVSPGSIVFPPQLVSKASAAQSVIVLNSGTGPMQIASVAATAPFTQTNNCSAAISPGAGCTIMVSYTPPAVGSMNGSLTIAGNAGAQTVALAGSGVSTASTVTVAPSALLFPQQLITTKSAAQTVTITNTGKTSVTSLSVAITGDFSQTTTCKAPLAASKNCTVTVAFTPTLAGSRTGVLTINLSTGTQSVSLSGVGSSGSLPSPLTFTPSSVTFSNYIVGDNPTQTVTVTNTGASTTGLGAIALSGDPSITQSNKCPSLLAAGATCSINVTFRPKVIGTFTSNLIVIEASGVHDIVPITATAGYGN